MKASFLLFSAPWKPQGCHGSCYQGDGSEKILTTLFLFLIRCKDRFAPFVYTDTVLPSAVSRVGWVRASIVHCHWGQSSLSKGERSLLWPLSPSRRRQIWANAIALLAFFHLLLSSVEIWRYEWVLGFVHQGEYIWLLLMARRPRTFLLSPWDLSFHFVFLNGNALWEGSTSWTWGDAPKLIRAFIPLWLAAGESPPQAFPTSSRSHLWSKMTKRGT